MSEESTSTTSIANGQGQQTPPAEAPKAYEAPATQADLDRIIESRLARERSRYEGYEEYKQKAAQLDAQAEASKTELQKVTERAEKAEREAQEATAARLRFEVAAEKELTAAQAARLIGDTKELLLADADQLLADFKPADRPHVGLRIDPPAGNVDFTNQDGAARAFFGI